MRHKHQLNSFQRFALKKLPDAAPMGNGVAFDGRKIITFGRVERIAYEQQGWVA